VNKAIRLVLVHTRLYALACPSFFPRSQERDFVPVQMRHMFSGVVEEINRGVDDPRRSMDGDSVDEAKRTCIPMRMPKYGRPDRMYVCRGSNSVFIVRFRIMVSKARI
jgi:hypothetical protein